MADEVSKTKKDSPSENGQRNGEKRGVPPVRFALASGEVAIRLGLAFALVVALLVAVGNLALRRMDQINADLQDITGSRLTELHIAREAATYSTRNSRLTMQIFLVKDKKEIGALLADREENTKRIAALIAKLDGLCDAEEEARLMGVVKDTRRRYIESYGIALHLLLDERQPDAAAAVMVERATPALLRYQAAWEGFVRYQEDQIGQAAEDSRKRYIAARRLALLTLAVAVAAAGIVALSVIRRMVREITARLQSEKEALRLAHREAEVFINAVPSILIGLDRGSHIRRWNPIAAAAFGFSEMEVVGKKLTDCGVMWQRPDMREEIQSWCSERGSRQCEEVPFEMRGRTRLLGLTITSMHVAEGDMCEVLVIGSDITDRQKIEAACREAEGKYHRIFDEAIVGVFQTTPSGQYLSANPAIARILGYDSPGEMIASLDDVASQAYVDPVRRGEFIHTLDTRGVVQNFECELYRKDGSKIWASMSARAIREEGIVVCYEGMAEDVTERKVLHAQLLQAQKLESVGQLAAGIAHEINTPTQYIGDNVRFLKDAFGDLEKVRGHYERLLGAARDNTLSAATVQEVTDALASTDADYLFEEIPKAIEQTLEGIGRVAKIVGAMKEFSHPGSKEKTSVDLNHAIENTITVARNEWKYVADVETEFDPTLPLISCLPGEFNQVILNLIVNAAHAIAEAGKGSAEKGKITVQTRDSREWAEIRIQDTGVGIPEKVRARIFDPFFTTKETGKGTGQGLAIARSVVVGKHGGTIDFETEEGKGTTFIIRLPKDGKALAARGV